MITRVQICEKYGISPATFNEVQDLLKAKPQAKHGRILYKIDPRDDFILRCAKNHIYSFGGSGRENGHILPFHRFLCLKFLTTPQKEAVAEIHQRNLASPKFGLGYYKKLEKRFLSRIPKELKDTVKKRKAPSAKQKGAYEMLLRVIGVIVPYSNPLWMDNFFSFLGDAKTKNIIESVVTTRGTRADHQAAMEELSGQQWKNVALDLYMSVFYDIAPMTERDWRYYLGIILPTERKAKSKARGMTTGELRIREGKEPHFQETLRIVAVDLEKKILATLAMKGEGFKHVHQHLNSYTKVGVTRGDVDKPVQGGSFFQNISIVASDREFKSINAEIQGQLADGRS